jgi:hypothetical protein
MYVQARFRKHKLLGRSLVGPSLRRPKFWEQGRQVQSCHVGRMRWRRHMIEVKGWCVWWVLGGLVTTTEGVGRRIHWRS